MLLWFVLAGWLGESILYVQARPLHLAAASGTAPGSSGAVTGDGTAKGSGKARTQLVETADSLQKTVSSSAKRPMSVTHHPGAHITQAVRPHEQVLAYSNTISPSLACPLYGCGWPLVNYLAVLARCPPSEARHLRNSDSPGVLPPHRSPYQDPGTHLSHIRLLPTPQPRPEPGHWQLSEMGRLPPRGSHPTRPGR